MHTLSLAEALADAGLPVQVVSLGDPDQGFFRPVRAPSTLVPAPEPRPTPWRSGSSPRSTPSRRGLRPIADEVDVLHTQDCISARAAARVRDAGARVRVVRTVHHVDDFTTAGPDRLPAQGDRGAGPAGRGQRGLAHPAPRRVRRGRGRDPQRRRRRPASRRSCPSGGPRSAAEAGVADRFVFLSVGGIEPRKGSVFLFQAMAILARRARPRSGAGGDRRALVPGLHRLPRRRPRPCCRALGLRAGRGRGPGRHGQRGRAARSGTAAPTRWHSRPSRRAGAWPCSRP